MNFSEIRVAHEFCGRNNLFLRARREFYENWFYLFREREKERELDDA